jgi:hypothetical protein
MRRSKPRAAFAIAAGAALALSACSGGGGEENNMAMNAAESGFGNAADPSAVETMGNGAEPVNAGNDVNGTGETGNGAGTKAGGDAGGNAAGGTSNGM